MIGMHKSPKVIVCLTFAGGMLAMNLKLKLIRLLQSDFKILAKN